MEYSEEHSRSQELEGRNNLGGKPRRERLGCRSSPETELGKVLQTQMSLVYCINSRMNEGALCDPPTAMASFQAQTQRSMVENSWVPTGA
jgi:hypothetical protein